jgi:hypothetical protein
LFPRVYGKLVLLHPQTQHKEEFPMSRIPRGLLGICLLSFAASSGAQIKLVNKDGKSHDLLVKCSSSSDTSIGASSTRDLGKGPCTVTVKSSKTSASASGKGELVIQDGKIK